MAWYDTGTVAVTNGSTTVTGTGTNFLVGAQIGEAFLAPDGSLYEIASITSATVLVLADPYLGGTQSGQSYKIVPTQSLVADLASDVTNLISTYQSVVDGAGSGKFQDGTVGAPAITFEQDQDNGLYRIGVNNWGMVAAGAQVANVDSTSINFPDNKKATFGTSDDLQIYHDGTNSFISDQGAGELRLLSDTVRFMNSAGTETIAVGVQDGAFFLQHNNSNKLVTTATGIDVTGTVVADGLTVDGTTGLNWAAGAASSGLITIGTGGSSGGSAWFNTPSLSSVYHSGLGISGSYASNLSTIKLGAYGVNHASYSSEMVFLTQDLGTQAVRDRLKLHNNGDISFYEDTGTTAKFFWDASAESLNVGGSTNFGYAINVGDTGYGINSTGVAQLVMRGTEFRIQGVSASPMKFYTSNTERLRIDSSGNVGIGTATINNGKLGVIGGDVVLANNAGTTNDANQDSPSLRLYGTDLNTTGPRIYAKNVTSFGRKDLVIMQHSAADYTTESEAARITHDGNLLVGTTSLYGADGTSIQGNGTLYSRRTSAMPLYLRRDTTDGDIVYLEKDGTNVGSIASGSGEIIIGRSTTGLKFQHATAQLIPRTTTNTTADAVIDLGSSTSRFKDLYLSGGVYLGGTVAANHLDDYEEGAWTPVLTDGTTSYTWADGTYVKIGKMVTLRFNAAATQATTATTGAAYFTGLPFAVMGGNGKSFGTLHLRTVVLDYNALTDGQLLVVSNPASSSLDIISMGLANDFQKNVALNTIVNTSGGSSNYIGITITYEIA